MIPRQVAPVVKTMLASLPSVSRHTTRLNSDIYNSNLRKIWSYKNYNWISALLIAFYLEKRLRSSRKHHGFWSSMYHFDGTDRISPQINERNRKFETSATLCARNALSAFLKRRFRKRSKIPYVPSRHDITWAEEKHGRRVWRFGAVNTGTRLSFMYSLD